MPPIVVQKLRTGMGAIPHTSGVAFRVWAPNADAVYVIGSFNDWSPDSHPMIKEDGGCWYVDIAVAAIGDEYRYRIVNGDRRVRVGTRIQHNAGGIKTNFVQLVD
jgi:1,4-alpha-glucan branching enzyme